MNLKMRMTQILDVIDITPHTRRIVLSGNDLSDFPAGMEGAHVKIILPKPGELQPKLGFSFGMKKRMRSYTVRFFDAIEKHLTIDFVVNDHRGIASDWAARAKIGDCLGIAGPGKTKYTDYNADWHLLVADLTGLPALAASLEKLPEHAQGYILVQVPSSLDKQSLHIPSGMKIQWIIDKDPKNQALLHKVKSIEWKPGTPAIFVAADSTQVMNIRKYLEKMPNYSKVKTYASPYWKS